MTEEETKVFVTEKASSLDQNRWHAASLATVTTNGRYRGRPKGVKIIINKPAEPRPKTFYFFLSADIRLLNYVLQCNPFHDPNAWTEIVSNLRNDGFNCSPRQCKDRVRLLVNTYQQNNMDNLNKIGSAAEWEARENLIRSVIAMKESNDGHNIVPHTPNSIVLSVPSDVGEENSQVQEEPDQELEYEDDVASASLVLNDMSSDRSMSVAKRRKVESFNEAMILKTKLDHELAMAKLQADIEDKQKMRELEAKRLELDERRLVMQDEDRKRQAALSELQMKESMAASIREDKRHTETMQLQKTLVELLAKFISTKK